MNSSEEGRGTWLPDPEASVSSPPPILISATLRPGLCVCVCVCVSHSVVSNSLPPHGLWPAGLLCAWGFSRQGYWSGLPLVLQEGHSSGGTSSQLLPGARGLTSCAFEDSPACPHSHPISQSSGCEWVGVWVPWHSSVCSFTVPGALQSFSAPRQELGTERLRAGRHGSSGRCSERHGASHWREGPGRGGGPARLCPFLPLALAS